MATTPSKTKFNPIVYIVGVPVAIVLGGTAVGPLVNLSLVAVFVAMLTNQIAPQAATTLNPPASSSSSTSTSTSSGSQYQGTGIATINPSLASKGASIIDWLKQHL